MLLRSLRAVNFLGHREIVVPELPTHGVVAIEEKSDEERRTIRDLILFALFGRTSTGARTAADLIQKGAGYTFVELAFAHPRAGHVSILRGLDRKDTVQVSLREPAEQRILNREDEVNARMRELVGDDPERFMSRHFLEISSPAPSAGSSGQAPTDEEIEELVRERKRIQGRLRRARKRMKKLEKAGDVEAASEAREIEEKIATSSETNGRPPVSRDSALSAIATLGQSLRRELSLRSLAGRIRELEAVARRLKGDRRRTGRVLMKLETEKREVLDRLRRVNEYKDRRSELQSAILAADLGFDVGNGDAAALADLDREIRRTRESRDAKRAFRWGLVTGGAAIAFLVILVILNSALPRGDATLVWVNPLLGLLALIDLAFAVKSWRDYGDLRQAGADRGTAPGARDPLVLLSEIQDEYADVMTSYRPGLVEELKKRLGEIDGESKVPAARQVRLDDLLRTLETEWKRARRECPDIPEGPEEDGGDLKPLSDAELEDLPGRLNGLVDRILKLAVRASDAASGGPPATEQAVEEVLKELESLLKGCGDDRDAADVLKEAGFEAARDAAEESDPRKQEGSVADLVTSLRATVDRLPIPATSAEDEPTEAVADLQTRLSELTSTVEVVEDVQSRLDRSELELEEVTRRLADAREGKRAAEGEGEAEVWLDGLDRLLPALGFTSVKRNGSGDFVGEKGDGGSERVARDSDLGSHLILAKALKDVRGMRADLEEGSQFVLFDASNLGAGLGEAAEVLELVERIAPEVSQVVVVGQDRCLPKSSPVRIAIE